MDTYKSTPVNCNVDFSTDGVKGKTAIVTGGASGLGAAYTHALAKAGAHVLVADISDDAGKKIEQELSGSVTFVRCDVTQWNDQKDVFKKALEVSPKGRIDIVVANAGIAANDTIFQNDVSASEPDEPVLNTMAVNATGVLLTVKLALWYFRKQFSTHPEQSKDQCLVLKPSVAGYSDLMGVSQYSFSKFGVRGLFVTLRKSEIAHGIRVNLIAPWYIKTAILSETSEEAIDKSGAGFATAEDAATALMRIVSDDEIIGRALSILPREWEKYAPRGYADLGVDDYQEGTALGKMDSEVNKPLGWIMQQVRSLLSMSI